MDHVVRIVQACFSGLVNNTHKIVPSLLLLSQQLSHLAIVCFLSRLPLTTPKLHAYTSKSAHPFFSNNTHQVIGRHIRPTLHLAFNSFDIFPAFLFYFSSSTTQPPQHRVLFSVAVALSSAVIAMAQDPSSSGIPLNSFLDAAHSAASAVSSANAKQTTSSSSPSSTPASSTSAAATSSPSSAPAKSSGSNTGLIVGLVVGIIAALLLGILITLLCCCLARRRRRRRNGTVEPVHDEEIKTWRSDQPANPGRTYSPPHQHNRDHITEQQPLVPNMAMAATPNMAEHPAHRHENPFVPVPPSPRRGAPNSRPGLTDGTVPGAEPYIVPSFTERTRVRGGGMRMAPRSRSHSNTNSTPSLPIESTSAHSTPPTQSTTTSSPVPLSGIGQPYEDMHVHVLQTDGPSRELRNSIQAREPIQQYTMPPQVPNRSPHRRSDVLNDGYDSSTTNSGSGSGEDLYAGVPKWEQSHNRYSNSPTTTQTPLVPWAGRERGQSHSPRQSRDLGHQRMESRSSATSINGQPRRLRFSDVQAPHSDACGNQGYSHGVGEAM